MFISKPKEFNINVKYEKKDNLDIIENYLIRENISDQEFSKIKSSLENNVRLFYLKMKDILKNYSDDVIATAHIIHFKELFNLILTSLPCYEKVKSKGINGKTIYELSEFHINKFKMVYKEHFIGHKCGSAEQLESILSMNNSKININMINATLKLKLEEASTNFQKQFLSIRELINRMNEKQVLEIVLSYFSVIMMMHIKNVECFESSVVNMGNKVEDLKIRHEEKITSLIKVHEELLQCNPSL